MYRRSSKDIYHKLAADALSNKRPRSALKALLEASEVSEIFVNYNI
jgi:hypothetical protein